MAIHVFRDIRLAKTPSEVNDIREVVNKVDMENETSKFILQTLDKIDENKAKLEPVPQHVRRLLSM